MNLIRCRMYTAFALYRLNHDGNGVFGTCIFECLQIIVRCIGESVGHRSESNLASVARLTGCGHGTEGSSMEAHLCSYDVVTVRAVFSRCHTLRAILIIASFASVPEF